MTGRTNISLARTATLALAAFCLLFASSACVKSDISSGWSDDPVGFSTYGQKSTKAGDTYVSTTAFNLNDVIGVFGFYTQSADWSASSPVNFMFNENVVREAYEWTYDPVKYWPNVTGEKLSFWGYYPQGCTSLTFYDSSDNEYANTAVGLPAKAVFTQEDDAKDHIDLMFSKFENGYERNLTKPAVDALVNLRFTTFFCR